MENGAQSSRKNPQLTSFDRSDSIPLAVNHEKSEIHFLVTHWLNNYIVDRSDDDDCNDSENQKENKEHKVVNRIHDLAGKLADAFTELGAYGNILEVSIFFPIAVMN